MLLIFDVLDGDEIIAVEFTDDKDTWFYVIGHSDLPSLRIGKFPCKSSGEKFLRRFRIKYEDSKTVLMCIHPDTIVGKGANTIQGETQSYEEIGAQIGRLVTEKQAAYGDSFGKSGDVLRILYPDGIKPDQYDDALAIVRIIDKLFSIANNKDAFGESPYKDIAGYGILGVGKSAIQNPQSEIWKDAHGL